jgi:peptidylprolyl isomerase
VSADLCSTTLFRAIVPRDKRALRVCHAFTRARKHCAFISALRTTRRSRVRFTPVAALTALTLAAVLLTGCTTEGDPPSLEESIAPVDLCALAAPAGSASGSVTANGNVGDPPTASFPAPLSVPSLERTVLVEGGGEKLGSESLVGYAMTVFDATTGEVIQSQGYDASASVPLAAVSIGQFLGCASVGSRIAVAVPATDDQSATVWVLDVLEAHPGRATGTDKPAPDGMPGVELGESGAPTIDVPDQNPPNDTEVAVLKKGAGETVAPGDSVTIHYTGVRWSDNEVFDSSWNKGAPTVLTTTDAIPGYRLALEGQTVGSQVLVVIPPSLAYGEGDINETDLIGETLVFVVDILASTPPA